MSIQKIILFFICCASLLEAVAQRDGVPGKLEWGTEIIEPNGTRISKIITAGSYGFYALRVKNSSSFSKERVYVEFYDSNQKLKRSQEMELKYKGKLREFEDVVMVGGKLYLLTSFNNQVKKKNYLFSQQLSKRLIPSKTLVKIGEIDSRNIFREGEFDLVISRDSSKVMLYNQLPYQKNEPERFAFRVFDNQFNELWTKDIVLPYNDNQFAVEEYRIDKNGNIYLLGVLYQDRVRVRRQGRPNYQYIILAYSKEGTVVQEYKIDLSEKFITDLTFRIANDGKLVCSGFYSDKGTYSIKGTYFFRIDPETKSIFNKNLHPFDFDFLTEHMTEGRKEKAQKAEESGKVKRSTELYQYSLDELILRSDGGALMVAEQYYVYERSYRYFDNTIRYDYYYHYNDIIVVNIRPNGEIEWTSRIPKRQETVNDGGYFSSYAMSIVKDRLFFIFNDNSRNFEENNASRRLYNFNGRYSVIALTELRKDGSSTTYPFFTNSDADIITRPKICKQVGSRRMIVYGERGRTYRFANLEFQ